MADGKQQMAVGEGRMADGKGRMAKADDLRFSASLSWVMFHLPCRHQSFLTAVWNR